MDPAAPVVKPERVLARVSWRLIPFLALLFLVAFLDRINVGFAALEMDRDLHFSDTVYGFGAGIFFLGYFLCEVPSNLALERFGARLWLARIMVSWGVIAAATAFVRSEAWFYALRFLLGVAEAGFFPGIVLYLTYWFPRARRARAVALFTAASPVAGVIGGPLSGAILTMHGAGGLAGWQWLFLLEGLPAALLGVVAFFYLTDRPEQATWLAPAERSWLREELAGEQEAAPAFGWSAARAALLDPRVWRFAAIYLLLVMGVYGVGLWLPQLVKSLAGFSDLQVGLITAVPYLAGAVGTVWNGWHSDHTGERRWHVAGGAFLGAAGVAAAAGAHPAAAAILALTVASAGIWSFGGPFWAMPTALLTGSAAAAGIALINSVGNLSGFAGPYLVGLVKDATGSFAGGLLLIAGSLLFGGLLVLRQPREKPENAGPVAPP